MNKTIFHDRATRGGGPGHFGRSCADPQGWRGRCNSRERTVLYWKAPMDPNYRRDAPGKSPMGMDLVPVYADEATEDDPSVVSISPTIINNLGVRTALVQRSPLSRRVETVGYVSHDEDTLQHIHTRVDGWIEKLAIKASGDPVRSGQLLFELYSPTLVNAQEEYLAAKNSGNATLLGASRQRLDALGVTGSEISRLDREQTVTRLVKVLADTDGYAAKLGVREGIYITPATEIMSIAKLIRSGYWPRYLSVSRPGSRRGSRRKLSSIMSQARVGRVLSTMSIRNLIQDAHT